MFHGWPPQAVLTAFKSVVLLTPPLYEMARRFIFWDRPRSRGHCERVPAAPTLPPALPAPSLVH